MRGPACLCVCVYSVVTFPGVSRISQSPHPILPQATIRNGDSACLTSLPSQTTNAGLPCRPSMRRFLCQARGPRHCANPWDLDSNGLVFWIQSEMSHASQGGYFKHTQNTHTQTHTFNTRYPHAISKRVFPSCDFFETFSGGS